MTDRYTKGVLTIIAVLLAVLVVQSVIQPVGAIFGIQKVAICDNYGWCLRAGRQDGSLPVYDMSR
jgi:hypothetical protein